MRVLLKVKGVANINEGSSEELLVIKGLTDFTL